MKKGQVYSLVIVVIVVVVAIIALLKMNGSVLQFSSQTATEDVVQEQLLDSLTSDLAGQVIYRAVKGCTDKDGEDFFTKSVVSSKKYPKGNYDYCRKNNKNGMTYLMEGSCKNGEYAPIQKYCPDFGKEYYCEEGKCVTDITCIDSDGDDVFTKTTTKGYTKDNEFKEKTDFCMNIIESFDETISGKYIREFVCDSSTNKKYITSKVQICPSTCYNGACMAPTTGTDTGSSGSSGGSSGSGGSYGGSSYSGSSNNLITNANVAGGYKLGSNDFFYSQSANDVNPIISSSELPKLFGSKNFVDNEGSNKNKVGYSQVLRFQKDKFLKDATVRFEFAQDDDVAPNAAPYLFFSDKSSDYAWNYSIVFDDVVIFDDSSQEKMEKDLVGTSLNIMEKKYVIVDAKLGTMPETTIANIGSLKLFGGKEIQWLSQGESVKTIINEIEHKITMADINVEATACKLIIDDQSVSIDEKTIKTVNGIAVGVIEAKDILSEVENTDVCYISIGAVSIELGQFKEVKINGQKISDVNGWYADAYFGADTGINSAKNKLKTIDIRVRPDNDKVYLAEGQGILDPVFGSFKIVFEKLANNPIASDINQIDKEIQFKAVGKSAQLLFTNPNGNLVKLPMKAKDGDSNVYFGNDINSAAGMMYLQGEKCIGETSIEDCKGALFLVSEGKNYQAHLIKIIKIDTTDKKISFEDLTVTGCKTEDKSYKNGYADYYELNCGAGKIYLGINEKSISFKLLGDGYTSDSSMVKLKTNSNGFLSIKNKNQVVEQIAFYEEYDNALTPESYLTGSYPLIINAFYDDSDDNAIEFSHALPKTAATIFGKKNVNDKDDDNQMLTTLKGTVIAFDDDSSKQKIEIYHPINTVYAQVYIVPIVK